MFQRWDDFPETPFQDNLKLILRRAGVLSADRATRHPRRAVGALEVPRPGVSGGRGGRGAGFPLGPGAGLPWAGQTQLRGRRQRATCCIPPTLFPSESAKCSFLVGSPFFWRGGSVGGRDPLLSRHPATVPSLQGSRGRPCVQSTDQLRGPEDAWLLSEQPEAIVFRYKIDS